MKLTTTSYAILGLLDLRDWNAYELAQQAGRSLAHAWPVSESQLYAEPKRLAEEGLITIDLAAAGPSRRRQTYAITPAGRRELRGWLARKPAAPRLHAEVMLRCLFATSGTKDDLINAVESTRQDVVDSYVDSVEFVEAYLRGDNPFPERLHVNLLWMTLVRDLHMTILDWTDRALEQIDAWQDTTHGPPSQVVDAELQALPLAGRARGLQAES
jgi:DNA-binding PadR family transcriptional regulator